MYTDVNFKTKKAMKEAVKNNEEVTVYQPGMFPQKKDGEVSIEGPHYPKPHTWYARVRIANGVIVKVLS